MPTLQISPGGYKRFITELRNQLRGGGQVDVDFLGGGAQRKWLRFRASDFYVTHVRNDGDEWRALSAREESYTAMGVHDDLELSSQRIRSALLGVDFAQAYSRWSQHLAILIFITSEAARSQFIYQHVQLIISDRETSKWKDYEPYVHAWKRNVGRRPPELGPLREADYLHLKKR